MSNSINVAHLATLTNIPVSDEEVSKFSSQFESTLDTIKTLEELSTEHVLATPQVTGQQNVYRDDIIDTSRSFSQQQALANAKQTHNGYFVVPAVLNE